MTISNDNFVFAARYYRLLRAWVLHNERHRRAIGNDAADIQIPLEDFVSQYEGLDR